MTPPALTPTPPTHCCSISGVVLDISFDKVLAVGWSRRPRAGRHRQAVLSWMTTSGITRSASWTMLAFFAGLRCSLDIGLTDDQFLEGWNALFAYEMPGIAPMLERAARSMPLYAFSNTNPAHVAHFSTTYSTYSAISESYSCHPRSGFGNRMPRPITMSCGRSACRPRASCSSMTTPKKHRGRPRARIGRCSRDVTR